MESWLDTLLECKCSVMHISPTTMQSCSNYQHTASLQDNNIVKDNHYHEHYLQ